MSEYIGHFSLWGEFEVDEISNILGLQPSCVYRKEHLFEGAEAPTPNATWDYYCPSGTDSTMQEQVESLMALLWPRAEVVQQLSARFTAEMNLVGTCVDGAQVLSLKPETMQRLTSLALTLNCFYIAEKGEDGD